MRRCRLDEQLATVATSRREVESLGEFFSYNVVTCCSHRRQPMESKSTTSPQSRRDDIN